MIKRSLLFSSLLVCVFALSACASSAPTSSTDDSSNAAGGTELSQMDGGNPDPNAGAGADADLGTPNGTYEDTFNYSNPGGEDEVGFKLVVDENGIVTDADATVLADNSTSVTRQTAFKNGIKAAVVGKSLDGLTVDRVGGSSLTSKAFNEWVAGLQG